MEQLLSINEAAAAVGVHRRTIYRWIVGGKLEVHRTVSGKVRIRYADLWQRPAEQETQAPIPTEQSISDRV